jgi:hypothetical protein
MATAAATPSDGCRGLSSGGHCTVFIEEEEEEEEEGDGAHKVQVNDGTPHVCLGMKHCWHILELKVV